MMLSSNRNSKSSESAPPSLSSFGPRPSRVFRFVLIGFGLIFLNSCFSSLPFPLVPFIFFVLFVSLVPFVLVFVVILESPHPRRRHLWNLSPPGSLHSSPAVAPRLDLD